MHSKEVKHTLKHVDYDYFIQTYEDILILQQRYLEINTEIPAFYRGQANSAWNVAPSILRNDALCEFKIIQHAITCNQIKIPLLSPFEYIAKMQHYGYATRFLDLTTNIDVALYFACADGANQDKDGHLFMFAYNPREPSNTEVIILSELCLLQEKISVNDFSRRLIKKYTKLETLFTDIQELNMIITSFCDHGFVVLPKQKDYKDMILYNPRIHRQCGAFFICGNKMQKPLTSWDRLMTHSGNNIILPKVNAVPSTLWHHDWSLSIIIPSRLKSSILLRLKEKGITESYLFAEEKSN